MIKIRSALRQVTPGQSLIIGFLSIILVGTFLLSLPASSSSGNSQFLIDAFFTATSAVTTTGLIVVDTGTYYSLLGQVVILVLFQVGGLGYITIVVYVLGQKPSLRSGLTLQESFAGLSMGDIRSFVRSVIMYTIFFELTSTALLTFIWMDEMPLARAFYFAFFHSVSAFCTAGFSIFSDNLSAFNKDIAVNVVIIIACLAGGAGFFVLDELRRFLKGRFLSGSAPRLSVHTRIVIYMSALLVLFGTIVIYFCSPSTENRLVTSIFQAVSASTTTGFNTIDIASLGVTPLFSIIILMFIGASPAGSGGGIKSTTFALILAYLYALLMGRKDVNLFKRKMNATAVSRASAVGLLAIFVVVLDVLVLGISEDISFLDLLFEVVSALGTVGLSTGVTAEVSVFGKLLLCLTMFAGRLGPLLIAFSFFMKERDVSFSYVEEDVYVG